MKDLVADNMSLRTQLEAIPAYTLASQSPCCGGIQSPLSWVLCLLAYAAVLSPNVKTGNLLTERGSVDRRLSVVVALAG